MKFPIAVAGLLLSLVLLSCVSTAQRQLAERYYNIATDYYNEKNYKQAVSYYQLALKQDPNLQLVFLNYGLALIEVNDYSQAELLLKQAYAIDLRNTLCLSALGYLSFRAEKYDAAATWYRKATAINSYNPETYYNLGVVEQQLGNYQASKQAFDKVAELQDPKEFPKELRRFSAVNALYLGNEDKAMALYSEYFANGGNDEAVFQAVYDFYGAKGQYDKLTKAFSLFDESLKDSALAAYLLSELYYLKLGNSVLGLENLKAAIDRRFPDEERLQSLLKKLKGHDRSVAQKLLDEKL